MKVVSRFWVIESRSSTQTSKGFNKRFFESKIYRFDRNCSAADSIAAYNPHQYSCILRSCQVYNMYVIFTRNFHRQKPFNILRSKPTFDHIHITFESVIYNRKNKFSNNVNCSLVIFIVIFLNTLLL